jgi:hypothetical protein
MPAIAMGLAWLGWAGALWGWCLLRGYNISFTELIDPAHPFTGPLSAAGQAGNQVVFPGGTSASAASAAAGPATIATSGGNPAGPATGASVANSALIQQAAAAHNPAWGKSGQFNALTHLIAQESGGNPAARNPTSGALGIAQALGHGGNGTAGTLGNEYGDQYGLTTAQAQAANSGDPVQQLRWMMGYIQATYGSPAAAWAHEQQYSWY